MVRQLTYRQGGDAADRTPRRGIVTNKELRIQAIAWFSHLPRDYETAALFIDMLRDMNEWRLGQSSGALDDDFNALVARCDRVRPKAKLKLVKG